MSNAAANVFSTGVTTRQRVKQKNAVPLFAAIKIIIVVLLFTVFYLWSRLEVVSLGYEIAKANKERGGLMDDNRRLKLETLSLKSPQRIEAIAIDRLGLVY
ncbi:MAG: cell division protein FtsL, partial [Deltaproteobacteria bacterium]|nr:cell division protein FtsL [Deltaproteobacteria bacterium]